MPMGQSPPGDLHGENIFGIETKVTNSAREVINLKMKNK